MVAFSSFFYLHSSDERRIASGKTYNTGPKFKDKNIVLSVVSDVVLMISSTVLKRCMHNRRQLYLGSVKMSVNLTHNKDGYTHGIQFVLTNRRQFL